MQDICNYTITQSFTERLEHIRVSRSNKRVTKSKKKNRTTDDESLISAVRISTQLMKSLSSVRQRY